jgi:copper chaperone
MALKLKVSNLAGERSAETITESIHLLEPQAKVDVDVNSKTVTVESKASEESIKQVIVAAGYTIEGY